MKFAHAIFFLALAGATLAGAGLTRLAAINAPGATLASYYSVVPLPGHPGAAIFARGADQAAINRWLTEHKTDPAGTIEAFRQQQETLRQLQSALISEVAKRGMSDGRTADEIATKLRFDEFANPIREAEERYEQPIAIRDKAFPLVTVKNARRHFPEHAGLDNSALAEKLYRGEGFSRAYKDLHSFQMATGLYPAGYYLWGGALFLTAVAIVGAYKVIVSVCKASAQGLAVLRAAGRTKIPAVN